MNEKIEELVKQCTTQLIDYDVGTMYDQVDHRKLAELIVLEMCNVLDKAQWDKGEDWVCADGTRIIPQIKEHFGVE